MPDVVRRIGIAALLAVGASVPAGAQVTTIYINKDWPLKESPDYQKPQPYRDPASGILFYVESDGRHISALSPTGQVLWTRYPFMDAMLPPYRENSPPIVHIGAPPTWVAKKLRASAISIVFRSTQFGLVYTANGDFEWLGQD